MATTLKAFQQEISSISDQKKAEHLRDLRQQAQQAAQQHGKSAGANKAGHAKPKPVKKVEEVKSVPGDGPEMKEDEEDASIDVPDVSVEVRNILWISVYSLLVHVI